MILFSLLQVLSVPAPPSPIPARVDRRFDCKVLTRSDEVIRVEGTLKNDEEFRSWVEYRVNSKVLPAPQEPTRAYIQSKATWNVPVLGRNFVFGLGLPGVVDDEGLLIVSVKDPASMLPEYFATGICDVSTIGDVK